MRTVPASGESDFAADVLVLFTFAFCAAHSDLGEPWPSEGSPPVCLLAFAVALTRCVRSAIADGETVVAVAPAVAAEAAAAPADAVAAAGA